MTRKNPQSPDGTILMSASEMADAIKNGTFSAEEGTDAHIRHIQAVNPALNAVVISLFDQARAQARKADEARARGEPLRALHGVPVTIKEQYKVRGTQTTLGATNKIGNLYDDEGPLVTKLRAGGAIILGKTNIVQTLLGQETILPQPGPIARTAADLLLAVGVFATTSTTTTIDNVPPVPWIDPVTIPVKGMRIGYYTDNGLFSASPARRRAVEEAAATLRNMGAETVPVTAPDPFEAMRIFLGVMTAGGAAQIKSLLGRE